ncbi:MAG: AraC family transcriptional regulator [Prochlorococcaceae cyanobacterium]
MGIPEALVTRPLLFRTDLAITDTKVEALGERLALGMNVRDLDYIGEPDSFLYRATTMQVGDLVMVTGFHCPMHIVTEEAPRATVILALGGETTFSYQGGELHFGALHDLAYLPGCPYEERSSWISGVLFSVDVDRLAQTTAAMAGFRRSSLQIRKRLQSPQLIRPQPGSGAMEVVQNLRKLFTMLDAPNLEQDQLLELLCLDDLIYRTMAMAFCGDLIRKSPQGQISPQNTKAAIIEELLGWIGANLDRPISLSELEQRSSYSQRTLRAVFQERFGCGPHEWIRRQRMEVARQRLLHPQSADSVSSVAHRCGYTHLSQFSRDFYRAFGVPPSGVLRQGKLNLA